MFRRSLMPSGIINRHDQYGKTALMSLSTGVDKKVYANVCRSLSLFMSEEQLFAIGTLMYGKRRWARPTGTDSEGRRCKGKVAEIRQELGFSEGCDDARVLNEESEGD
jgi:hypothetical protein